MSEPSDCCHAHCAQPNPTDEYAEHEINPISPSSRLSDLVLVGHVDFEETAALASA
jgi:hypothetical protein